MPPLSYDPEMAARTLAEADPPLGALIRHLGPAAIIPRPAPSSFAALARAILYQQLSGKAAATIHGRVLRLLDAEDTEDGPQPDALLRLSDEDLRGAGVSRPKLAALRDLAAKTIDGVVPPMDALREMDDDDIVERLTAVRGVGPWTAQMLLIFTLGRPDVLPAGDLGVRKGFMRIHGLDDLPHPDDLARHCERWRPYRSVASWYCWRALEVDSIP